MKAMPNWVTRLASKLGLVRARPAAARSELDDLLSEVLGGGVVRTSGLDEHGRFVAVVEASSAAQVSEQAAESPVDFAGNEDGGPRTQEEREEQR